MKNTVYDTGKHRWQHDQPCDFYGGRASRWMLGPCPRCGTPTSTYGGGYSCHADYCPHSASMFVCSAGPKPEWWNTGVNVKMDGDMWCAHGEDFTNLQESIAGFGKTPDDAVKEYFASVSAQAQKASGK